MNDGILQILLLLAYSGIGLISVTIAVYAISISYLGRKTAVVISKKKEREKQLRANVRSINTKYQDSQLIQSLMDEVNTYRQEQKKLQNDLNWLSLKRAVILPSVLFFISLFLSALGIIELATPEFFASLSLVTIIVGFLVLVKSLSIIEKTALEIPRPEYEVFFDDTDNKTKLIDIKKPTGLKITVHNIGNKASENFLLVINFDKELDVLKTPLIFTELDKIREVHARCARGFSLLQQNLNIDGFYTFPSFQIQADKKGKYKMYIVIKDNYGSKSEFELTIIAQ